ncbi:hypothetical protein HIM_06000 [Hirsutella minnesotensis 3608]|uniref:Nuclear membrane fusion protein Kar5 n=1 Tax=Hirsutella minnesotensis 3608 TaxID=1043627 RepID=A0A0F7ZP03_9HYPO|nr:hypothetical protein HIM_06000 [Hirsutella minnesotensis 3608]
MAWSAHSSLRMHVFHLVCICSVIAQAFSWGTSRQHVLKEPHDGYTARSLPIRNRDQSPNIFAVALRELQELESEPLCHRIAARLLVNNCQLLDGRDEATVLTDSGRATRDFVDSFAASLAICDLSRGSFRIPASCSKFREPFLAEMPVPSQPRLHVSPQEIDSCLEGLAQSDSAWNTWISYRHKALRFCDAARADNEKDRNIQLFQKITTVLDKLTSHVEADLDAHLDTLSKMFHDANANVATLGPQLQVVKAGLYELEHMITETTSRETKRAASLRTDLDSAQSLEHILARLIATALDGSEGIIRSTGSALEDMHKRLNEDVESVISTLEVAAATSSGLQEVLIHSHLRAAAIAKGQERIEENMQKLNEVAGDLTIKHEAHQRSLEQAQQKALQVLDTLEVVSSSAGSLKQSLLSGLGLSQWWPYLFCPLVTLTIGSYGLPPSASRNIALVGMGEIFGFMVSVAHKTKMEFLPVNLTSYQGTSVLEQVLDGETPPLDSFAQKSAVAESPGI